MKLSYTYLQNIFGEGALASEKYLKKNVYATNYNNDF